MRGSFDTVPAATPSETLDKQTTIDMIAAGDVGQQALKTLQLCHPADLCHGYLLVKKPRLYYSTETRNGVSNPLITVSVR